MVVYLKNIINETLLKASLGEIDVNSNDVQGCTKFVKDSLTGDIYFAIENLQSGIIQESEIDNYINFNILFLKENNILFKNINIEKTIITPIDESIQYLIDNERSPKNLYIYNKHYDNIKQHILSNEIRLNESSIFENYNKLFDQIPADIKIILEEISIIEDKKAYFLNIQENIINTIKQELSKTTNVDEKLLLYEAKENISSINYDEKTYVDHIVFMKKMENIITE